MLTEERSTYYPFEYPLANDYWLKQQQVHWFHTEVSLASDINDYESKLTDTEKYVIETVLKTFTQTEIHVNDYWRDKVARWFPKPEIRDMCSAFCNMESVHTNAYSLLNQSLGITDYEAYLKDPIAKQKIDNLVETTGEDIKSILKSLAVFSAFVEGVCLFSSFAILLHFSSRNLLKGISQIISYSIRDESMHSEAGCWLYRTLLDESITKLDKNSKNEKFIQVNVFE